MVNNLNQSTDQIIDQDSDLIIFSLFAFDSDQIEVSMMSNIFFSISFDRREAFDQNSFSNV